MCLPRVIAVPRPYKFNPRYSFAFVTNEEVKTRNLVRVSAVLPQIVLKLSLKLLYLYKNLPAY